MKNIASKELIEKLMEYGEKTRLANYLRVNRSQVTNWTNNRCGVPKRYHKRIQERYGFAAIEG